MITIDDVINFILSTDDLTALPTIMDALTERMASELGMVSNASEQEEVISEETPEEAATEEATQEDFSGLIL